MQPMRSSLRLATCCAAVFVIAAWGSSAHAYDQYSQNGGDATNCGTCHGDFRQSNYTSPVDGMDWGNIHNLHRFTMLNSDCDACHGGSSYFPVLLASSTGGTGLAAIGCVGCHGRAEDNTPANPAGYGAGLRQKHYNGGVTGCTGCHDDADPANFTPVAENVLPPYYANPGTDHSAMPTGPCGGQGENFAGDARGLDNDGDGSYDDADPDCVSAVEEQTWGSIKSLFRLE